MTKLLTLVFCGAAIFLGASFKIHPSANQLEITDATKVWKVMSSLGKVNVNALYKNTEHDVQKGQELVNTGQTTDFKGKPTPSTSPKLTCIACHSTQPEHPAYGTLDPQKRLEHADSMSLPFLPGPPLYGVVNRISFFMDDYQHKFQQKNGFAIRDGHRNIRLAIQACNTVYAKGRNLANWELESILAYLWTLELKMGDLGVPDSLVTIINESIKTNRGNSKAVNLMRYYYPEVYPATLVPPIPVEERQEVSPILNDYKNGRAVWRRSCLHCHANRRFSSLKLDSSPTTFKWLKKHMDTGSRHDFYDAVRYSPNSKANRTRPPHYTAERMSDKQLQDLRFFILQRLQMGKQADAYYGE